MDQNSTLPQLRLSEVLSALTSALDMTEALTADRPYRKAMPVAKALSIMTEDIDTAIDGLCFAALKSALTRMNASIAA